ncbi:hypothetical protein K474DRAFT_1591464 [Panus rudis PR-1116 ss-1]|nr:hypothetical protein K474DRAFT_1591464 [Panus rudis PR-1116 ss-1]
MPITNPSQLVDEYKKLGEFDRLRRELLAQFQEGEHYGTFIARIEEIIKERLAVDSKLQYMPEAVACRELAEEVDRYPVVERAVADLPRMSDSQLASTIHRKLSSIVDEDRYSTLSRSTLVLCT